MDARWVKFSDELPPKDGSVFSVFHPVSKMILHTCRFDESLGGYFRTVFVGCGREYLMLDAPIYSFWLKIENTPFFEER